MNIINYLSLNKKAFLIFLSLCFVFFSSCGLINTSSNDVPDITNDQAFDTETSITQNLLLYEDDNISIQQVTGMLLWEHKPKKIIDISSVESSDSALILVSLKSEINSMSIFNLDFIKGSFVAGNMLYTYDVLEGNSLFFKIDFSDEANLKGLSYIDIKNNKNNLFIIKGNISEDLHIGKYSDIHNTVFSKDY